MEIEFWENHHNKSPVLEFILKQKNKSFDKKINKMLLRMKNANFTNLIQSRFFKKLSGFKDIYEIAFKFGNIFYRFLLTIKDHKVILLHAFKKKSNNTPKKEIILAKKRKDKLN